eukprot:TRINITY_DN45079_c2_g1_i1.p1 TRINITY_DN45079_c2_g1~~TRINITY_DN45079_c2_g1_i1.p1  ORF type:complete len:243 (-),score=68.85 TRINITY_DN45079_c2_g1_i1:132-860(-)
MAEADGTMIRIGGIPKTSVWQELKDFLKPVASVVRVDVIYDDWGNSKGVGFAQFNSEEDAQKVISELNKTEFSGTTVAVGPWKGAAPPKNMRPEKGAGKGFGKGFDMGFGMGFPGYGMAMPAAGYGMSPWMGDGWGGGMGGDAWGGMGGGGWGGMGMMAGPYGKGGGKGKGKGRERFKNHAPTEEEGNRDPTKTRLVTRIKAFQKADQSQRELWYGFCGENKDPMRHTTEKLTEFVDLHNVP